MAVRTHDSKWRLLVSAAPLLGVAFLVTAVAQGEPEVLRSFNVMAVLAAVAALGSLVAWWTGYQLRAAPAIGVALAQAGAVALQGHARALPGATPLLSPDGTPCLWFKHTSQGLHHYNAADSVRPFLLVDGTGQCIVLPAGADITGHSKALPAAPQQPALTDVAGHNMRSKPERLLLDGDDVHVVGWFTPASAEAMELQAEGARLVAQTERPGVTVQSNDAARFSQQAAPSGTPPLPPPAQPAAPMALPVVGKSAGMAPFVISIASQSGQAGLYRFLAAVDGLVLCAAAANCWWLTR